MDQDKKEKLSEMDSRWNFEKEIQVPNKSHRVNWRIIMSEYNHLQDTHGDLYMTIDKLPCPSGLDKARQWYWNRKEKGYEATIHNSQIYNFFEKLAFELEISVGEAVSKVINDKETLRDYFDLGQTVNVSMNNVDAMDTRENSQVSKDELKELIEDE